MATHRIEVDIFDNASIFRAVGTLERFMNDFDRKLEAFWDELAAVGQAKAQSVFGNTTTVTVEKTENGRRIVAQGTEEAYFVEFGTGVYAGTNASLYENFPDGVFPGSYSESDKGKHTWSAWINAGGDPMNYRYNSEPQSAMYKAYEAIINAAPGIARKIFK